MKTELPYTSDLPKWTIAYEPNEKYPWYVKQCNYLDYGRFSTKEAAEEHMIFCEKEDFE